MNERKKHRDHPGYQFDTEGNVWSFKYNKVSGSKLRLLSDKKGYLYVMLWCRRVKKPRRLRVNRLICELFHGPPPSPKHQARHLNGIKKDNRPSNLSWGTQKENEDDKIRLNKQALGIKNGAHKLTEDQVRQIRLLCHRKSSRFLAAMFDVSHPNILKIIHRKTWKHI